MLYRCYYRRRRRRRGYCRRRPVMILIYTAYDDVSRRLHVPRVLAVSLRDDDDYTNQFHVVGVLIIILLFSLARSRSASRRRTSAVVAGRYSTRYRVLSSVDVRHGVSPAVKPAVRRHVTRDQ